MVVLKPVVDFVQLVIANEKWVGSLEMMERGVESDLCDISVCQHKFIAWTVISTYM